MARTRTELRRHIRPSSKPHRVNLWAYAAGAFEATKAVVYDLSELRAGENAKVFLSDWERSLVYDDAQVGGYQDSAPGLSSAYMVLLQF